MVVDVFYFGQGRHCGDLKIRKPKMARWWKVRVLPFNGSKACEISGRWPLGESGVFFEPRGGPRVVEVLEAFFVLALCRIP